MDLVDFLKARLDEDEAIAKAGMAALLAADGPPSWPDYQTYDSPELDAAEDYLRRFGPVRAMAEVGASARLLAWASDPKMNPALIPEAERYYVLTSLALPYAEHPDYDEAWRPGQG